MKNFFKLSVVLFLAALSLLLIDLGSLNAQSGTWNAKYWNNRELSGNPVLEREEASINYNWRGQSPGPGVNADDFSVRWRRTVNLEAGTYRFTATMDDGMRVRVNDITVINAWEFGPTRTVQGDLYLPAGNHVITVEYFETVVNARAQFNFEKISSGGTPPADPTRWFAEYYNNKNLSGAPSHTRFDNQVKFNWYDGAPAPGIGSDNFSVRWTRNVPLTAGRYRFTVIADDGVRLWVNNRLLIDRWQDQAPATFQAEIDVPAGNIPIRVEYFESTGGARIDLTRTAVSGVTPLFNEWQAEYFNNKTLSGSPAVTRSEQSITYNWGNGSPAAGINADGFSARWTRTANFNAGTYRFTAVSDDGIRVYVNNQLVINQWHDHASTVYTADVALTGGAATVRVEYYDNSGGAEARVSWTQVIGNIPTPVTGATGTVGNYRLNVRISPQLGSTILTQANPFSTLQLVGRNADNSWLYVITANGTAGWVYRPLVNTSTNVNSLPLR